MNHNWLRVLVLIAAVAPAAQARVEGGGATLAALPPAPSYSTPAMSFADQIGAVIAMRTTMVDRAAPQPTADCKDPGAVQRRLAALADLDAFTRTTINGLIDAAPTNELKTATSEQLIPVLLHHRGEMTATLLNLMELPLVREKSALSAAVGRLVDQAARP